MANGIHPRLKEVITAVDAWCYANNVSYDIGVDESDLQGLKIFQKDRAVIGGLLNNIHQLLNANRVHVETQKVRGGTIIAFSLTALSEARMRKMLYQLGEELEHMTFADRIADALTRSPKVVITPPTPVGPLAEADLLNTANKLLGVHVAECDDTKPACDIPKKDKKKQKPPQFGQRVAEAMETTYERPRRQFYQQLREALGGIATQTGQQPRDLFSMFARALRVLGDQMGVGPLQDRLKEQGINWKKSDDGQSIILYIMNASTNAAQPIARVSAETLENPRDFEEQLTTMLDFAKGDAPGAFQQKQEEIKNQEKAVRDIARAVSPASQQSEAGRAMNASTPGEPAAGAQPAAQAAPAAAPAAPAAPAQPAAAPAAPAQPQQSAGQAAAATAAAPKPAHPSM